MGLIICYLCTRKFFPMKDLTKRSKYLALILRHDPAKAKLSLDKNGWAGVADITDPHKGNFDSADLDEIVKNDAKGRYEFNGDRTLIRAVQGHSLIDVEMECQQLEPPATLYHGTKELFMPAINAQGLRPMGRQFVHLSAYFNTAQEVAGRRLGNSVILKINAVTMFAANETFYLAKNGVWLVKHVLPEFLSMADL